MAVAGGALVLTALLDAASQARFEAERQLHFPPAINFLAAHVTLFHALPDEQRSSIVQTLDTRCSAHPPAPFETGGLRFLGRGVAYDLHMPDIITLRSELAAAWRDWLTPQDRQGFRPHVTVQNKVAPELARTLLQQLQLRFAPWHGQVRGLALWRYDGGPWTHLHDVVFQLR